MKKILPVDAILMPENATKVFAGQIFEVYQWPQKMFDGSTKTFEMLRRADTVQVLAIKDGLIAIVADEQPGSGVHYKVPGGRTDEADADYLESAKRELAEETGLQFNEWSLKVVPQVAPKIEHFVPTYVATGLRNEGEQKLDEGGERIKLVWWTFDNLKKAVLSGDHSWLVYHAQFFAKLNSLDELINFPEFSGQEVDR